MQQMWQRFNNKIVSYILYYYYYYYNTKQVVYCLANLLSTRC